MADTIDSQGEAEALDIDLWGKLAEEAALGVEHGDEETINANGNIKINRGVVEKTDDEIVGNVKDDPRFELSRWITQEKVMRIIDREMASKDHPSVQRAHPFGDAHNDDIPGAKLVPCLLGAYKSDGKLIKAQKLDDEEELQWHPDCKCAICKVRQKNDVLAKETIGKIREEDAKLLQKIRNQELTTERRSSKGDARRTSLRESTKSKGGGRTGSRP